MTKLLLILTSLFFTFSLTHAENDNASGYVQLIKSKKKKRPKKPAPQQPPQTQQPFLQPLPSQMHLHEPYRSVQLRPYNLEGWYGNAMQIEKIFRENQIEVAIEIGCWVGLSTTHIASLLPTDGNLYAIDHWKGSVEHQGFSQLPTIYEQFLSNVIWLGLTDRIVPMRMSSLEASPKIHAMKVIPDLIYLDASHDTASVLADLNAWFPRVEGHGIMCGDDWECGSVKAAVEIFAEQNGLTIEASGNFWRLIE
jgi:hypothetical protein